MHCLAFLQGYCSPCQAPFLAGQYLLGQCHALWPCRATAYFAVTRMWSGGGYLSGPSAYYPASFVTTESVSANPDRGLGCLIYSALDPRPSPTARQRSSDGASRWWGGRAAYGFPRRTSAGGRRCRRAVSSIVVPSRCPRHTPLYSRDACTETGPRVNFCSTHDRTRTRPRQPLPPPRSPPRHQNGIARSHVVLSYFFPITVI